jgi:hypothetical protein
MRRNYQKGKYPGTFFLGSQYRETFTRMLENNIIEMHSNELMMAL